MSKPTVTVKVQMVVEVTTSTWNAEASYLSVKDQSIKEAKAHLSQLVKVHGKGRVTILGEPRAVIVTMAADPQEPA